MSTCPSCTSTLTFIRGCEAQGDFELECEEVTAARRQRAGVAAARYGRTSHHLVPTVRLSPPAFYGVPPASRASDVPDQVPTCRAMISVSRESIRPGMDVYDHDGAHVGCVKDVHDAEFLVGR